ncbi:acetoacetate--CoA ligase [Rhodococcus qingshengii]|uniref:acetoacetate--CoA ligase n=1 Tax=Rhodococcus qingshengii TaxID=334542 RepID=UPI00237D1279|nr:acetoacetate--CoA ligase [Rhodococcus qingshengii]WCT05776.1 acetoacetate--CoA ligase [Rhodococcus qingshengii]
MTPTDNAPDKLDAEEIWSPNSLRVGDTVIAEFMRWLEDRRDLEFADYAGLHEWSVRDLDGFWSAITEFFDVKFHDTPTSVLGESTMPGAQWFPGATLNYAERALSPLPGQAATDVALIGIREDGAELLMTYAELREKVSAVRAGLRGAGVQRGDRVAALAPNIPETTIAFLATVSLGAVWSCCSPDFGSRAVLDRFAQIEPTVFFAVEGYRYGGKHHDIRSTVDTVVEGVTSIRTAVHIPYEADSATPNGMVDWSEFTANTEPLVFDPVPFDHPLWILYSSGTTGLPKGIVQSHGGIVIEHLKALALQFDLRPGDRLFWFTTTGWMMWNLIVSGLLVGSTVVLYDGSPGYPGQGALWSMVERHRINIFGASAAYLQSCMKSGFRPRDEFDLSTLRMIASTGSPLPAACYHWVFDAVSNEIPVVSSSGGTDICSAFLGGAPTVPVWVGELSCPALGAAVSAFDMDGNAVIDQVGELVITRPMPSMPIGLWNDSDGTRLRAAYFDDFPGVWRHGDWIEITARGSSIIYGRSDSTLNRGGVRIGTSDLYTVLESADEVLDSLVVDTSSLNQEDGELLCFLALAPGVRLDDIEHSLRSALRTQLSPRHVPDRFLVVDSVPRTLNGKKCEVPVKKILNGVPIDSAVSTSALANPDALVSLVELVRGQRTS